MPFELPFRLIERSDVKVTRPALERAQYKCQRCPEDEDLRVIDYRGKILVLCGLCRVKTGQPTSYSQPRQPKPVPQNAIAPEPAPIPRETKAEPTSGIFKLR